MPKFSYRPVDRRHVPTGSSVLLRLFGLVIMALTLSGVVWLMLSYSFSETKETWVYAPAKLRTNFRPIHTTEELREQNRKALQDAFGGLADPSLAEPMHPSNKSNDLPDPFGNELPDPHDDVPPPPGDDNSTTTSALKRKQAKHELGLVNKLTNERWFQLLDETQTIGDWVALGAPDRDKLMNEFKANRGAMSPPARRLAFRLLKRLKTKPPANVAPEGTFFHATSQVATEALQGRPFQVTGRLFDVYRVELNEPTLLADGTEVTSYYEGVVAYSNEGANVNEHPIEHRVVEFQTLTLPDSLEPYLTKDAIRHSDKLVTDPVWVSFTGVYYRLWVYSREVKPFSTERKRIYSQARLPVLLTENLTKSDTPTIELTETLLQQVNDAVREDPVFVETESAYYMTLAVANRPDDEIKPMEKLGYFDLSDREDGPKYRGEGVHVQGMIGDDYAPIIFPPNVSGLRRVYRALVLDDMADLNSPKRYLVDMIESPKHLEPRALVEFDARYYRNVFVTQDSRSEIRPLLVVKQVRGYAEGDEEVNWIWISIGVGSMVLLIMVLAFFVISDRRERAAFEANAVEISRQRIERRGGLRLKPLPTKDDKSATDDPPKSDDKPDPDDSTPEKKPDDKTE